MPDEKHINHLLLSFEKRACSITGALMNEKRGIAAGFIVALAATMLSVLASFAYAQAVSHPASEIVAGDFGIGNFRITGSLNVTDNIYGNLNASYIQNAPWITSYGETDPLYAAGNATILRNGSSATFSSIITTGNVGIGTASPSQKLTVNGSANVSGTVYAANFSSNSPLQLQTGGTTRIFVNDTTGNVGIGTTGPGTLLDVQGAAQFGTGNVNLIDSAGKIAGISSAYFTSLDGSALTTLDAGNLASGTVPSDRLSGTYGISISGNANSATSAGSAGYATSAGSAPASDVSAWAKASTKPSYGFTEISGTATDAQVPNTITIDYATSAGSATSASSAGYANTAGSANNDADISATNEIQTLGTSGNTITLTSGGSVTVPYATSAANADACTNDGNCEMPGSGIWNSGGNVGIGTATPSANAKLEVVGGMQSNSVRLRGDVFGNVISLFVLDISGGTTTCAAKCATVTYGGCIFAWILNQPSTCTTATSAWKQCLCAAPATA